MCLRFPFLYPRNRFSNKHYTNWDILDKQHNIYLKWLEYSKEHQGEYLNKFGWDAFFNKKYNNNLENPFEDNFILSDYVMKLASKKDRFKYWLYGFYHQILEIIHFIPTYNELDAMDTGWKKRFGIRFCKDLKEAIIKDCGWKYMIKTFRVSEVKESYGYFEFYVNYYTPRVNVVIDLYRQYSKYICIDCGDYATKRTIGYICSYCDKCHEKGQHGIFRYLHPRNNEEDDHNKEVDEMLDKC